MIILDATTKSLQFKLSGAITTNQLPFSASYVDTTGTATTPGEQDGASNNTTAVTIVASPASSTQRLVKNIVIQNADTVAATVTITYNNNSTLRNIIIATLSSGDQLNYEDGYGWACLDKNGNLKTSGTGGGGGSGTVTSVGLSMPAEFAVSGSPVTTSGTLSVSKGTQSANLVYAGPSSGAAASPTFRSLVGGDLPAATISTLGAVIPDGSTITISSGIISSVGGGGYFPPGGRLSLASATPVMTLTVSGAATVYYCLYLNDQVPIYNGSSWTMKAVTELTNVLANSSTGNAGPAAVTTNSNYDLFVWSNGGTPTLTRGPLWTSTTARGTGAGTTELQQVNGIWTNKQSITNGPGANLGTYVGTIMTNGTSTVDFNLGGTAAGGTAGSVGVWNMYNRKQFGAQVQDNTSSWTYGTASWRAADGSNGNRVSYVTGLNEDLIEGSYAVLMHAGLSSSGSRGGAIGIGQDSTTTIIGNAAEQDSTLASATLSVAHQLYVSASVAAGLGQHYLQAVERAASLSSTFFGAGGVLSLQTQQLNVEGMY